MFVKQSKRRLNRRPFRVVLFGLRQHSDLEFNLGCATNDGRRGNDQALRIIESRINALGVSEPTLQTHGAQNSHQIFLQMPE